MRGDTATRVVVHLLLVLLVQEVGKQIADGHHPLQLPILANAY